MYSSDLFSILKWNLAFNYLSDKYDDILFSGRGRRGFKRDGVWQSVNISPRVRLILKSIDENNQII